MIAGRVVELAELDRLLADLRAGRGRALVLRKLGVRSAPSSPPRSRGRPHPTPRAAGPEP